MPICKGIARHKGVKSCGKESSNRKFGLCPSCLYVWMNDTDGGRAYKARVFDMKVERKIRKLHAENKKRQRDELTNWRSKLQTKVQEIARLIDIGLPCLALGTHSGQMHGGHIWAKGPNTSMSLNLHNIHRQSAQSNMFRNDDGLLRERLSEEYGVRYLNFVRSLKSTPTLHWSNMDYMGFYKTACSVVNELKKRGQNFDLEGRIDMRNVVNSTLGIYSHEQVNFSITNN